ncbi:uncharacterized protein LOC132736990 [Ruditapes philippinarum]|uniref:uncharacterized protein LOC132736990 n=1 Tax=Ruditapes philippinarum TaxID=129788 RepID=UPI00295BF2BA|nr:uncharacterized protein LOC132736990 [Ruditapes philippinarum]
MLPLLPKKGLTLPGYNYCGPGNPLVNGSPVNQLDEVCMNHDYCYDSGLSKKENSDILCDCPRPNHNNYRNNPKPVIATYIPPNGDGEDSYYPSIYAASKDLGVNPGLISMCSILKEEEYCMDTLKAYFNKPLKMTKEDEALFKKQTSCNICGKEYEKDDIRVRDHCHITGKFRGSAHSECNINFILTRKIPVIFHNLRGYDSHFIMQQIGKFEKKIDVIPNNMEKYMAFMISNLIFIDSFQFMSQSLDNLVKNIPEFKFLPQEFDDLLNYDLLKTKGVYPYDFMDSFEKFEETKLPSQEEFYSVLNEAHISDSEYTHAKNVWKKFKIKTMGEYHDLYLKTDVLLLADVFENFRKTCLEYYKLDPCHYFSSPGLAWDAMLKMTGIKLDLISDIDIHLFIEKGQRGGISYIANRYSKANNKYMKDYDKDLPSKCIMYLDANNLYGWAMSQPLPSGNFKWITQKQYNKLIAKGKTNFIIECDFEYPDELHDLHNDYPLAPEKIVIPDEWLSKYNSLCYEIETEDAYADFNEDKDLFDNSDYDPESKFYFDANKKVIGKFKDEAAGIPIVEFVGLRSKMYSYLLENEVNVKKCKGIKKSVVKKNIVHNNYKEALFDSTQKYHEFKVIRSNKHDIYSYVVNKISLSCYDDKRYILDNGINTLAYQDSSYATV